MNDSNYTIIRNPDLHDGYLTGLWIDDASTLRLICRHVEGQEYTVLVPKICRFRASNFLEGNIIFEFRVYQADQCTPELLYKADNSEAQYDPAHSSQLLEQMRRDKCIFIEIVPTYGCELGAIACCPLDDISFETTKGGPTTSS